MFHCRLNVSNKRTGIVVTEKEESVKEAFISDVDLRNGEGSVEGNEGGNNEEFFFRICFCFS